MTNGVPMQPTCNCADRSPTYPVYRDRMHFPDCVWWWVESLQRDFTAFKDVTEDRLRRLERKSHLNDPR